MKLISNKYPTEYAEQTVTFPLIGQATFDKNGLLEVDDEQVTEFLELTRPSFDFRKYIKPGDKVIKLTKEEKEALKQEEENKAVKEQLESLNFEQLVTLAKEAGIDLIKMEGATDGKLRKVLFEKMTAK